MKKRLLSILMVLCLAVSLVTPVVAVGEEPITYTDGTEDSVSQDTENPVEDSTPQDTETTTEDPSRRARNQHLGCSDWPTRI